MGRPRKPAAELEASGAFAKNPARRRVDAEGAGQFSVHAPGHLDQPIAEAWDYIVARLPKVALSSSDEVAVEVAAYCLAAIRAMAGPRDPAFLKMAGELRQCLAQLGMTPIARTRLAGEKPPPAGNAFTEI